MRYNPDAVFFFFTYYSFPSQDTVIALQALAYYAAFSGSNAIDLRLSISAPTSSFVSLFRINSTNFQAYQSQKVTDLSKIPCLLTNIYVI